MGEYRDYHISDIIEEINSKYFLPHIQRPFVWRDEQVIRLFDSLLRGYPIGTFLFWITKSHVARRRKFFQNYYRKYSKDFNIEKLGLEDATTRDNVILVLDGQQRLQALYLATSGIYEGKELYFDLLSGKEEDEEGLLYEFKFFKKEPPKNVDTLWVKVKDMVNRFHKKGVLVANVKNDIMASSKIDQAFEGEIENNLERLKNALISDRRLSSYDETETDYERIFDIFVRVNSGGTKLSKSDLLFSFIKLQWKTIEAEKEFPKFLETLNANDQFEFSVDFLLKTSLVLIGARVKYDIKTFTGAKGGEIAEKIENNWQKIKATIASVLDLARDEFRIKNKKLLPSMNALIPTIYYAWRNDKKSRDDFEAEDKKTIKNWLLNTLLGGVFRGSTDELLRTARKKYLFRISQDYTKYLVQGNVQKEIADVFNQKQHGLSSTAQVVTARSNEWIINDGDCSFAIEAFEKYLNVYKDIIDNPSHKTFPAGLLNEEYRKLAKITEINQEILENIRYRDSESYLVLYLIYPYDIDFVPSSDANYPEQDHIFSQRELKENSYDESQINRIGNIRLVTSHANKRKSDTPYAKWIADETDEELHLASIPDKPNSWNVKNYTEFVEKREAEILKRVRQII